MFRFDDVIMSSSEISIIYLTKFDGKQVPQPSYLALKTESCHDSKFVVAGDTGGCHNDNDEKVGGIGVTSDDETVKTTR